MNMILAGLLLLVCGLMASTEGALPPLRGGDKLEFSDQCPPGTPMAMCMMDPCDLDQCHVPHARCIPNLCGGCFSQWYDNTDGSLIPSCPVAPGN